MQMLKETTTGMAILCYLRVFPCVLIINAYAEGNYNWHGYSLLLTSVSMCPNNQCKHRFTFSVVIPPDMECIEKIIISVFRQLYGTCSGLKYLHDLNTTIKSYTLCSEKKQPLSFSCITIRKK